MVIAASRSLFSNEMVPHGTKTVLNPVTSLGGSVLYIGGNTGNGGNLNFSKDFLNVLKIIEQKYTSNNANKTYENIPTDYTLYLRLYNAMIVSRNKYKHNAPLSLLLQITTEGLTGALNSYGLNTLNAELEVQNIYLQNTIEEFLSGINLQKLPSIEHTGTLSITKTFELAPLFKYYIKLYGVPQPGEGFDPYKLSVILQALTNSGIDPYQ